MEHQQDPQTIETDESVDLQAKAMMRNIRRASDFRFPWGWVSLALFPLTFIFGWLIAPRYDLAVAIFFLLARFVFLGGVILSGFGLFFDEDKKVAKISFGLWGLAALLSWVLIR